MIMSCALFLVSAVAYAGLSSNFTVTSDYIWRGQTQTSNGPAVQGGMDYDHSSGFSVGTWLSNVSTFGTEADFYGKYSHSFSDSFAASLGVTFYHYTKSGTSDSSEVNLGFDIGMIALSINYMDDYLGTNSNSWYYNVSTSFDLLKDDGLALSVALGYTTFDKSGTVVGSEDYVDYLISLDRTIKEYTVSLFYTDTNRDSVNTTTGVSTEAEDHTYGISASRSF